MIVVVGLSHRTAPIEVRERFALPDDRVGPFLEGLLRRSEVREAFVVSTCNRVEIVAAGPEATPEALELAARACREALVELGPSIDEYLYAHVGARAVEHLFRVACSLDSLVVGEPQILGQLKQGFERARHLGTLGPVLHRTFPRAIRAAKRVRSETAIGAGQVSVPTVAVDLARQIFGELVGRKVLLVGSGEMGRAVARLFRDGGAEITVYGRRQEAADALAAEVRGTARLLDALPEGLEQADILVSGTSAPEYVVSEALVRSVRKARRGRSLFLIDLAVPRDIEPSAGSLDDVFLYNIDDLAHVVEESRSGRLREAEQAERILAEETRGFERWVGAEQATPVIKALRARLRGALEIELERSLRGRLRDLGPEHRAAVAKMLDAALNRMLHQPTQRLRAEAASEAGASLEQLVETLEELFELSQVPVDLLDGGSIRPPPPELVSRADGAAAQEGAPSSDEEPAPEPLERPARIASSGAGARR